MLPFTAQQFFENFSDYNLAIWPAQVAAYLLGLLAVALVVLSPKPFSSGIATSVLAAMWLVTGAAYHGLFFSRINPLALAFAGLFVVQALAITYFGLRPHRMRFGVLKGVRGWFGLLLIAYAMAAYPLVGWIAGHTYPAAPSFGLTPCPVVLFTWGLFLTAERVPRALVIIPLVWSLVGGSAVLLLGVPQDWPLAFSAVIGAWLLLRPQAHARAS